MITERPRKAGHPHEFQAPARPRPVERVSAPTLDDARFPAGEGTGGTGSAPARDEAPVVYYLGQRIYFRPIEPDDEPRLRRWINDPRVWRYLLHRPPINALREREYIEGLGKTERDYVFGIALRDSDRLIGSAGLHGVDPVSRTATFGLMIGDVDYHNQGYGTEATRLALKFGFQELNLNRIQLSVFGNNWRAIRVYQKVGFVPEGCLRQAQFRNGQYQDEYRFAMLREEWNRLTDLEVPENAYLARLGS